MTIDPVNQERTKELRKFGVVVGGIISAVALYISWNAGRFSTPTIIAGAIGALLVVLGILIPRTLEYVERLWMRIGILIGSVVSWCILFVLYFSIVTPIGFLARIFGKRFLELSASSERVSYWNKHTARKKEDCLRQF